MLAAEVAPQPVEQPESASVFVSLRPVEHRALLTRPARKGKSNSP
jgi:hypothetical protein